MQFSEPVSNKVQDIKSDLVALSKGDDIMVDEAHLIHIDEPMHEVPLPGTPTVDGFASK